ncbi:unnamed protein product [Notodromas monacha]|uniref:LIM zinc-binding domain-containing protein n=1 Tax=Notodromas monacha TaxID=399045 RepID=A0A7R9GKX0_9CRUS|nr:unnamed protein product [Notodromas monacha]CAG0925077.1 unnamed protein product [Notodromas monacha]
MIKTKDSPLTFHPECFNCDICNASLVSAGFKSMGERIFCAEVVIDVPAHILVNDDPVILLFSSQDYNRRYAPRCGSCGLPAAASATERTTKRITVLEKTYHGKCFKCEGCGVQLSENDQDCFPLHGKLLCENCHVIILDNEESKDRRRQLHKKRLPSDMILEICCGNSKSTTADGKLSYSDFFAKYSEECWPSSGSVEKM